MTHRYPDHVQRVYDEYEEEFGLDTKRLFFVQFPYGYGSSPQLYCGKLKDILDFVIDHKDFFQEDSILHGYIYEAKVEYVQPGQSKAQTQRKLRLEEAALLEQLKKVQESLV